MIEPSILAFDLGAESGRTLCGRFKDGRIQLAEVNRFPNQMLQIHGHWHWNLFQLFEMMKSGLAQAVQEAPGSIQSMAVDTWGVDFGLLGPGGVLLGLPFSYRDSSTQGMMERFFEAVPREEVYRATGIQFLPFNTLYQLFSMKCRGESALDVARDLLFMPDLFNYLFTGIKRNEFTIASTSQLFDPRAGDWSAPLLNALEIEPSLLKEIALPGTRVGDLDRSIQEETGVGRIPVIHAGSHDTASAVAAVPAQGRNWAYISSGTWSLMGIERKTPLLTDEALDQNFTNEGGVEGTFRLLKNITGLWLLQQCKKAWEKDRDYSYDTLMNLAASAGAFKSLVDPDHEDFMHPKNMPQAIARYCRKTGQAAPESPGEYTRTVLESLALKYRLVLDALRRLDPRPIEKIHLIGGGAQNRLLCQFTADATGIPVLAGPVEATAIGNIMVQAQVLGWVDSLESSRAMIARSFQPIRYTPSDPEAWNDPYERFQKINKIG